MITAGMSGPSIAYNEHRTVPAGSPRWSSHKKGVAAGLREEFARNKRAAKRERQARRAAPYVGPRQPPATPPRTRTVVRVLAHTARKAIKRQDFATAERCTRELGRIFAERCVDDDDEHGQVVNIVGASTSEEFAKKDAAATSSPDAVNGS